MTSRGVRSAAMVAVLAVIASVLAGCAPLGDPAHDVAAPLAFTVVADAPIVRVCVPMTVRSMQITVYKSESDVNGTVVWEADGESRLRSAQEFALGTAIRGTRTVTNEHKQYLQGEFALSMVVTDSRGILRETFTDFFPGDLRTGHWQNGNGEDTSVPCRASTCTSTPKSCDEKWTSTAADRRLTPTTTPTEIPASAPRLMAVTALRKDAISFTRVAGVVYAQLCASSVVDTEDFAEALVDTNPSKGWADLMIAAAAAPRRYPAGTRWRVGDALPGEAEDSGGGEHFVITVGTYRTELDNYTAGPGIGEIVGEFRASDLANGKWLNAAGKPEATACATFDASSPGG